MSAWMLGADYLEYIHDELVAVLWPGTEPIGDREQCDRALVESAAARPFHTAFFQDVYPTILEKGVALFHSINANHAFANGNKRTAVIAIDHFLMANDHALFLGNWEMYKIAEKTASYKVRGLSQDQILAEIRDTLRDDVASIETIESTLGEKPEFERFIMQFKLIRERIRYGADFIP